MSQNPLITPADVLQHGARSDFFDQFKLLPLTIKIVTGGAIGTMAWEWERPGDSSYSGIIQSESVSSPGWSFGVPDPAFATLLFAPGAYNIGDLYNVSSAGVVTGGVGAGIGLISATRFDPVLLACASTTSKAVTWLLPRCVPPIISVGDQMKEWLSALVIYALRSRQGMTPSGAGDGDDNDRSRALDAEKNIKAIGISQMRPPDILDSSPGDSGSGFTAQPISGTPVGWSC